MKKVLVIILFFILYLSGNSQTIYINKYLKDSVFSGSNRGLFFDSTHNGNWQPLATRIYAQNNGGGGGGGSGTVTSVSGLSPLFTTSNPTTTPTFSLSNTSQYNVFGRSASGSGAPSYISIDTTFISNFYLKTRGLISLTTTGSSGAATYNNTTGVLNIPQYSGGLGTLDTLPQPRWTVTQDAGGTSYKTTAPTIIYAADYGVVADGVTDDWAAIQAALVACNSAGGGTVILPLGKMMVSRPIRFPLNAYDSTDDLRSIKLLGQMIPNMVSNPLSATPQPQFGSIIEASFLGDSSVIDTYSSSGSWGDFNFLNITIENIAIRVRSKTAGVDVAAQGTGINATKMAFIQIENVSVSITSDIYSSIQPASTAFGILFPATNNFAIILANNVFVTGFYYGAFLREHASIDNIFIDGCYYGLYFGTTAHSMHVNKACVARTKYNVGASAGCAFTIDNVSFEDNLTSGAWWQNTLDLEVNAAATGNIKYQRVITGGVENDVIRRSNVPYNIIALPFNENTPSWTTAHRPTIIPDVATTMGYNTDSSFIEVYDNATSSWIRANGVPDNPTYCDQNFGVSLRAYYTMEQTSGNFLDASGNSKDLTRFGSAPTITGKIANGAGFTKTSSQYLKTSVGTGLSAGTGLTFTCWVKLFNTADTYMVIAQKGDGSTFNFEYNCYQFAGNVYWQMSTDGTNGGIVSVNKPLLRDSLWHFISGRWDGATLSLKVDNGTSATASIASAYTGTSATLYLGTDPTTTYYLTGGLDEVGIWNEYQTDAFITNLYNSGVGRTIGTTGGGVLFAGDDCLPDHDLALHWDNTEYAVNNTSPVAVPTTVEPL